MEDSWLGPPIDVRPLFARQQAAFIELLRGLAADEWARPTVCPGWDVKDIAAHVLADHISRLSRHRDRYPLPGPRDGEPLSVFLDRINGEWVTVARQFSPRVLIDQLSFVGDQITAHWQAVDVGAFGEAVSWAGPEAAPVWLDAARDFSEYWTHQQQICDATGRPGLSGPEYVGPVIDTFMRALPHTLRQVSAPDGTVFQVTVSGDGGGDWSCVRGPERWALRRGFHPGAAAAVEVGTDTAWRLCTRGITPEQAAADALIVGNRQLATAALQIVSIIWSPPSLSD